MGFRKAISRAFENLRQPKVRRAIRNAGAAAFTTLLVSASAAASDGRLRPDNCHDKWDGTGRSCPLATGEAEYFVEVPKGKNNQMLELRNDKPYAIQVTWAEAKYIDAPYSTVSGWGEFCGYLESDPRQLVTGQWTPGRGEIGCKFKTKGERIFPRLSFGHSVMGVLVQPGDAFYLVLNPVAPFSVARFRISAQRQMLGVSAIRFPAMDAGYYNKVEGNYIPNTKTPYGNYPCSQSEMKSTPVQVKRAGMILGANVYAANGYESWLTNGCIAVISPDLRHVLHHICGFGKTGDVAIGPIYVPANHWIVARGQMHPKNCRGRWNWAMWVNFVDFG